MAEKSMVERSLYPSVVLVKLKKDLSSQSLALKTLESPFSLPMGSGGMFTVTNSIIIPFVVFCAFRSPDVSTEAKLPEK